MQLPVRKSEQFRKYTEEEGPLYMTQSAIDRMKKTLKRLEEKELPQAIEDTRVTAENGDFSENAEYQEAKWRMRGLHGRVLSLKEKLKQVVVIEEGENVSGRVRLGSTVVVEVNGKEKTYHLVGPAEADPLRGNISHVSPLGNVLLGALVGESLSFFIGDKEQVCVIKKVS